MSRIGECLRAAREPEVTVGPTAAAASDGDAISGGLAERLVAVRVFVALEVEQGYFRSCRIQGMSLVQRRTPSLRGRCRMCCICGGELTCLESRSATLWQLPIWVEGKMAAVVLLVY